MSTPVQYNRDIESVTDSDLWPFAGGLAFADPNQSRRHQAIAEVLRRIPEGDFSTLDKLSLTFRWFLPDQNELGSTTFYRGQGDPRLAFSETVLKYNSDPIAIVVYLDPKLETLSRDICVAVAAHELAHIFLRHRLAVDAATASRQEEEVHEFLVNRWGFPKEARRLRAYIKRLRAVNR